MRKEALPRSGYDPRSLAATLGPSRATPNIRSR